MSEPPEIGNALEPPGEIQQASLNGDLVLFVGAGVSTLVGLPSWAGLAHKALEGLLQKEYLNYSELEQLKGLEPKKQLSIAELIAEKHSVSLELAKHLGIGDGRTEIYDYLNKLGCVCVTTNYDELLKPQFNKTTNGSTTAAPVIRINQKKRFPRWTSKCTWHCSASARIGK